MSAKTPAHTGQAGADLGTGELEATIGGVIAKSLHDTAMAVVEAGPKTSTNAKGGAEAWAGAGTSGL